MILLNTPRLLIRDHIKSDLQSHHKLLSDPKVMWFLQDIMTQSLEQSRVNLVQAIDEIDSPQRKYYFLRIENRVTNDHIG
ncbi:MAG: N-acetyltransferase, partial [Bacillota bacterium]|nr:N-acetyltransferase [Bacillota bacterium]